MLKRLNITAADEGAGYELFKLVRRDLRMIHERLVVASKDSARYQIASTVLSRGLGWGNYVERITYEQFENGVLRDDDWIEHGSVDLAWLPAFAGTSLSERMLNRRIPELDAGGFINRYRIARGRHYDFYHLYGTPAILKQLMLRQIEKAGRNLRAERKRPSENRQAKEDLILELVVLLVRRDQRQLLPATLEQHPTRRDRQGGSSSG